MNTLQLTDGELKMLEIALSTHLKMIDKELKILTGEDKATLIYAKQEYEELYKKICSHYYSDTEPPNDGHGLCPKCKSEPNGLGYHHKFWMVCHDCNVKWLWYDRPRIIYGTDEEDGRLLDVYVEVEPFFYGKDGTELPPPINPVVIDETFDDMDDDLFDDLDDDLPFFEPKHQIP